MTPSVLEWLGGRLSRIPQDASVLEVGSYDINGSARNMAGNRSYIGVDLRKGPGVDVVANGHSLPFGDAKFDCVVCAETLEHDDQPEATINEILRVLRPNGTFLVTVPGPGFPRHDYPSDYWRVTDEGLRLWLKNFKEVRAMYHPTEYSTRGVALK